MSVDGLDVRRISTEGSYNDSPAWSPRDKIARVAHRRPLPHRRPRHRDGDDSPAHHRSHNNEDPRGPRRTPSRLLVESRRTYDIYVMASEGGDVRG